MAPLVRPGFGDEEVPRGANVEPRIRGSTSIGLEYRCVTAYGPTALPRGYCGARLPGRARGRKRAMRLCVDC
jgi:hypothetical protein